MLFEGENCPEFAKDPIVYLEDDEDDDYLDDEDEYEELVENLK